jgi:hypothetical protein
LLLRVLVVHQLVARDSPVVILPVLEFFQQVMAELQVEQQRLQAATVMLGFRRLKGYFTFMAALAVVLAEVPVVLGEPVVMLQLDPAAEVAELDFLLAELVGEAVTALLY